MLGNFDDFNDLVDDIDLASLADAEGAEIDIADNFADAALEGEAMRSGMQTESLQAAMDNFARAINESAIAKSTGLPVRTLSSQYKGFIGLLCTMRGWL